VEGIRERTRPDRESQTGWNRLNSQIRSSIAQNVQLLLLSQNNNHNSSSPSRASNNGCNNNNKTPNLPSVTALNASGWWISTLERRSQRLRKSACCRNGQVSEKPDLKAQLNDSYSSFVLNAAAWPSSPFSLFVSDLFTHFSFLCRERSRFQYSLIRLKVFTCLISLQLNSRSHTHTHIFIYLYIVWIVCVIKCSSTKRTLLLLSTFLEI